MLEAADKPTGEKSSLDRHYSQCNFPLNENQLFLELIGDELTGCSRIKSPISGNSEASA